nr:hypothetical protein [Clostridia bacterium]
MKTRFSTILTVILVVLLIAGAVCIGGVKGYKEDREELLLSCMEMHSTAGTSLSRSIEKCEEAAADFDARLDQKLMGRIAASFGVEQVTQSVTALHAQLLRESSAVEETPDLLRQLGSQISELLEDNIDARLSLGKVFWTVVCLFVIFGKRGRRRGFTLGKLFAGFGLFNMWKKK